MFQSYVFGEENNTFVDKISFDLSPPVDGGPECTPGEETSVYLSSGNGNPRTSATS